MTDEQVRAMTPQQRRELIARLERPVSELVYIRRADMLGTETAPDQDRRNRL
jgi:hypothetical protein